MVKNQSGGQLEYAVFDTGWGWMGVLQSPQGLRAIVLPQPTVADALKSLGAAAPIGSMNSKRFERLIEQIRDYLAGNPLSFQCEIDFSMATSFQRLVWYKTKGIRYGQSRSYAWIASEIGKPKACRAVGQALGRNPLPIVIPCHRVVGSHGSCGGFRGGLDMKKRLLKLEGIEVA